MSAPDKDERNKRLWARWAGLSWSRGQPGTVFVQVESCESHATGRAFGRRADGKRFPKQSGCSALLFVHLTFIYVYHGITLVFFS